MHLQESVPDATEELHFSDCLIEVDCEAALQQCQAALNGAVACSLGLLLLDDTAQQHHYSSARPLNKAQLSKLQKLKAGEAMITSQMTLMYSSCCQACDVPDNKLQDDGHCCSCLRRSLVD